MGAWGIGPFDNDDATDLAEELLASDDLTPAREALEATTDTDSWLQLPEGARALAAAAVVAAGVSGDVSGLPAAVAVWLHDHPETATPADARLAMDALVRIAGRDSELREVRLAGEGAPAWVDQLSLLGYRLGRVVGDETS